MNVAPRPVDCTDLDHRIGILNSGLFYTYPDGRYDLEPVVGMRSEVEAVLGLVSPTSRKPPDPEHSGPEQTQTYTVTLKFQHPAWDEVNGLIYSDIEADSKTGAIKIARNMARDDGHLVSGGGRYWFTAVRNE